MFSVLRYAAFCRSQSWPGLLALDEQTRVTQPARRSAGSSASEACREYLIRLTAALVVGELASRRLPCFGCSAWRRAHLHHDARIITSVHLFVFLGCCSAMTIYVRYTGRDGNNNALHQQ